MLKFTGKLISFAAFLILCLSNADGTEKSNPNGLVECAERGGLPNFFSKLKNNKIVRIAYLGGSITAQPGWRVKSRKWFQKQFPKAKVKGINAAIGGTGSSLGVFRLGNDVLRFKPDLLFIEFAVNDRRASSMSIKKAFEGIIRQTWKANPETDICFVYTLRDHDLEYLQNGKLQNTARTMEEVARYYDIPTINMGLKVAQMTKAGKVIFKAPKSKVKQVSGSALNKKSSDLKVKTEKIIFSRDGVHPYIDSGHQLYQEAIERSMNKIEKIGKPKAHVLKAPMLKDNWEFAQSIPIAKVEHSAGWKKLNPRKDKLAKRFRRFFPKMWVAEKPGERLKFKFKGTKVAIYDLKGPGCGQVKITIDGKIKVVKRFDKFCFYYRITQLPVADNLADKIHEVEIELDHETPKKMKILFPYRRKDMEKNPEKYKDNNWYVGGIHIIGKLVE
jgi:lysophospholipase L1-like esterase